MPKTSNETAGKFTGFIPNIKIQSFQELSELDWPGSFWMVILVNRWAIIQGKHSNTFLP